MIVSRDLVDVLHNRGVPVFLVSGGFRCLITPVAEQLGIPLDNVFANRLKFYVTGELISKFIRQFQLIKYSCVIFQHYLFSRSVIKQHCFVIFDPL